MKCVCPMGGDRECPDSCLLSVWSALSPDDRKARRKPIAEELYKQGFTMQQIATQLGVSQQQISKDLVDLQPGSKSKPAKTATNPKGAGRPKGAKKGATNAPKPHANATTVIALRDKGVTMPNIAAQTGVPVRQVRHIVEEEAIRREAKAEPDVDRSALSMSAQEKLDAAIRQHQRKLDIGFEQRVIEEVRRRIDEIVLPHWKKKIEEARRIYNTRRGLMKKDTFNTIRRALHPDSRNSISDQKLGHAFDEFMALEKYLLDEKESPTELNGLPKTAEEWLKRKAEVKAQRASARTSKMANAVSR